MVKTIPDFVIQLFCFLLKYSTENEHEIFEFQFFFKFEIVFIIFCRKNSCMFDGCQMSLQISPRKYFKPILEQMVYFSLRQKILYNGKNCRPRAIPS